VFDDALIAIAVRPDEVYAGPHRGDVGPSSSLDVVPSLLILPTIISELLPPPVICGVDDIGNTFTNLMELWSEQAIHRTSYYTANSTFWNEDGYAGSADEEAMIGDATTSVNDVIHSLQLIDNIHADHPTWIIRNALDCGAGVGRVTKHVLLKRCNRVCLLEGCERWFKQIRRYLGKKRSQNCKFVLGQLEECSALEACCQGDIRSSNSRRSNNGDRRGTKGEILFDLIWIQWTLQYLIDADVVSTLLRMRSALTSNGRLIIKENRPCMHTVGTTESCPVVLMHDMTYVDQMHTIGGFSDVHYSWLSILNIMVKYQHGCSVLRRIPPPRRRDVLCFNPPWMRWRWQQQRKRIDKWYRICKSMKLRFRDRKNLKGRKSSASSDATINHLVRTAKIRVVFVRNNDKCKTNCR
jgi:hypothetical protein